MNGNESGEAVCCKPMQNVCTGYRFLQEHHVKLMWFGKGCWFYEYLSHQC